jgi:hypothetical protein
MNENNHERLQQPQGFGTDKHSQALLQSMEIAFAQMQAQNEQRRAEDRERYKRQRAEDRERYEQQRLAERERFEQELQRIRQRHPTPPQPTTTPTTTITPTIQHVERPRARYPDVATFSGGRVAYQGFKAKLDNKFILDAPMFPNKFTKAAYVFSRLTDNAERRILPWYLAQQGQATYATIITELDKAYLDQNQKQNALDKINNMKQGRKSINEFINEFDEQLALAGATHWDEDQKKTILRGKVNINIARGLVGIDPPEGYADYCLLLHRIEHDLQQIDRRTQTFVSRASRPQRDPNAMDWQPTTTAAPVQPRDRPNQKRATWVSDAEVQRRRNENLCLQCGKPGHMIRDCRMRPAQRPSDPKPVVATAQYGIDNSPMEEEGRDMEDYLSEKE